MEKVITGEITVYIPDSVLAECVYVLLKVYKVPKIKACEILSDLLALQGISQINGDILISSLAYLQNIMLILLMRLFTQRQNISSGDYLVLIRI
jgi:predicted nucleic-acid-binding protein